MPSGTIRAHREINHLVLKTPTTLDHLKSILLLPFMVIIMIPILLYFAFPHQGDDFWLPLKYGFRIRLGLFLLLVGTALFVQSVILFVKIGNGTLAPWDPTKNLVIIGLYRYMRNPMITGVISILLAESFLLKSNQLLIWALLFLLINHFYFILSEEPALLKKFGSEYQAYKSNVPRWIPRIRRWKPEEESDYDQ